MPLVDLLECRLTFHSEPAAAPRPRRREQITFKAQLTRSIVKTKEATRKGQKKKKRKNEQRGAIPLTFPPLRTL